MTPPALVAHNSAPASAPLSREQLIRFDEIEDKVARQFQENGETYLGALPEGATPAQRHAYTRSQEAMIARIGYENYMNYIMADYRASKGGTP